MAKNFKTMLVLALALVMFAATAVPAFAATETLWQGSDAKLTVVAGDEPYVYMLAQDVANNRYYYETSNHTVQVTGGGAVHLIPMVDSTKVAGEWTPDGIYNCGVSNYDVFYCCDALTGTGDATYYKRTNLEDGEYFTEEQAQKLRAIVSNAYPYVSVEEAKAALKELGFAQADELDRSELISATQAAIWSVVNGDSGDTYRYAKTATTAQKRTWGGYMHEFASEIVNFNDSTTSKKYLSNPNGVGTRVNALIDFYLGLDGVAATEGQIVISQLDITNTSYVPGTQSAANTVDFVLNVALNHAGDADDALVINVYVGGAVVKTVEVVEGQTTYAIPVTAPAGAEIKAVISGTQNLERGVYFYQPKPEDIDGDGIATSREVSQNLIGVASGETPVYAESTAVAPTPTNITFKSGQASNISFMLLDKATGAVEFLYKVDIGGQTSFEIPAEDGKVSVVFVKQSTSGMFWFSEEVDEELQNAAIECLKDNNPSYKGHNAVAFGEGNHELEFKKNKFVTYTFAGLNAEVTDEAVEAPEVEVEVEVEVKVEVETEKKNNGKGNNKKNK